MLEGQLRLEDRAGCGVRE